MRSRLIHALFPGKCRVCGKTVCKGDEVYFAKHHGVRCLSCGPHPADDQALPPKKGSKRAARESVPPTPAPCQPGDLDVTDPNGRAAVRCEDGIHRYEFNSVSEATADALCDYAQNDINRERIREVQNEALSGKSRWGN
ncbi:MAG: hypothetical protein ABSH20_22405, partial [Tepidisphaeraceae bacterium]